MRRAHFALLALLVGCTPPSTCERAELGALPRTPALAFVASDYASSAVGFIDADGALVTEAWLDSGTVTPQIVTALSGDVVLCSRSLAPCLLTVIDRFGTDVVSFLDVCRAEVIAQIDVGASFAANPQDVVALEPTRALVSRSTPNLDPEAAELDRGNDLLLIDVLAARTSARIDLSAMDVTTGEHIYARPERLVRLSRNTSSAIVVGLARLSGDFMLAGPGAVAIVDPVSLAPQALALDPLTNCAEVDAVPEHSELAVVTCAGPPFVTEEERRVGSGLVLLELTDAGVIERARWAAADHRSEPAYGSGAVPVSADQVAVTAMGSLRDGIPDRTALIDFPTGTAALLFEATNAFVIGDGAYDPASDVLYFPDADRTLVRRFAGTNELAPIESSPCRRLPPREIRPL